MAGNRRQFLHHLAFAQTDLPPETDQCRLIVGESVVPNNWNLTPALT